MLTQEGQEAARECLMRSGLADPAENLANEEGFSDQGANSMPRLDFAPLEKEVASTSAGLSRHKKSIDVPLESLERVYVQTTS
jgi:crossover junction endonuclease MUS81